MCTLEGVQHAVRVAPGDSVGELAARVAGVSGVPAERQRLVYSGRVLCDHGATVHSVGLRDGHALLISEREPPPPPLPHRAAAATTASAGQDHPTPVTPSQPSHGVRAARLASAGAPTRSPPKPVPRHPR